jgi:predicted transcriptional regulator
MKHRYTISEVNTVQLKKVLNSLLVLFILCSLIVAFVNQPKTPLLEVNSALPINSVILHSHLRLEAPVFDASNPLNQSTRLTIYNYIESNPGVHFRSICSGLSIPIGVAQYHLGILTKTGLISFFQDGRYKRYFRSRSFRQKEMQTISVLRHKTAGKILRILTENQSITHHDLASKIEISSQALSWQMKGLREMDLVDTMTQKMEVFYSLNEENLTIIKCCLDRIPSNNF